MKKSSATPQQLDPIIFFLDRNLGKKKLPALLLAEEFIIKIHDEHFDVDEDDDVWLAECGKRQWVVITPDTSILRDPQSMRAIGASRSRVFFLSNNNMGPEAWARSLIAARNQMLGILKNHTRPFIARVSPSGSIWDTKELTSLGREKKKPKKPKVQIHEECW